MPSIVSDSHHPASLTPLPSYSSTTSSTKPQPQNPRNASPHTTTPQNSWISKEQPIPRYKLISSASLNALPLPGSPPSPFDRNIYSLTGTFFLPHASVSGFIS